VGLIFGIKNFDAPADARLREATPNAQSAGQSALSASKFEGVNAAPPVAKILQISRSHQHSFWRPHKTIGDTRPKRYCDIFVPFVGGGKM
jgi:hypothetical protein